MNLERAKSVRTSVRLDDGDLLRLFTEMGEQAAFAELVRRHYGLVRGICRRLLGHERDAEDVTQAVFLLLARKSKHLSGRPCVAAWLHYVGQLMAMSARRSGSRRAFREGIYASQRDAMTRSTFSGFIENLDPAIADLPERYRLPILLYHMEGCSCSEIAEMLGCELGLISKRLLRGREKLRKRLVRFGVDLSTAGMVSLLSQDTWTVAP